MILTSMAQQKVRQHSFNKNTKLSHSVHQLSESTMKQYRSTHNCSFKRLITAGTRNDQFEDISQFELCSNPKQSSKPDMLRGLLTNLHTQRLSRHGYLETLLGKLDKASVYWMAVHGAPNIVAAGYNLQ